MLTTSKVKESFVKYSPANPEKKIPGETGEYTNCKPMNELYKTVMNKS
jgi:hypothetical protein